MKHITILLCNNGLYKIYHQDDCGRHLINPSVQKTKDVTSFLGQALDMGYRLSKIWDNNCNVIGNILRMDV